MPTRQRAKAHADLADVATAMTPSNKPLSKAAFMSQFNELLRSIEKEAPIVKVRELEARVREGQRKIDGAERKGVDADKLAEPRERLAAIKAELHDLRRRYMIPHVAYHLAHYLLDVRDRQDWPLDQNGTVAINLPGIVSINVEIPSTAPF